MQRVTRASAVAVMPAAPGAPGDPGYFTAGDPLTGTPATVPGQEWFNGVQEELIGLLLWLGLVPAAGDLAQVRKALSRWIGGAVRTVAANTTLTADDAGLVLASAAGGAITTTLPLAVEANGRPIRLLIRRTDASANALNLLPQGADTLNGLTGNLLLPVGATALLISDGVSAWHLVAGAGFHQLTVVTATGNATAPWWATSAWAEAWSGGASGSSTGPGAAGPGGGSGAYGAKLIMVTQGQVIPITVGAGGASVTGGNLAGLPGGSTSVGVFFTVAGAPASGPGNSNTGGGGAPQPTGVDVGLRGGDAPPNIYASGSQCGIGGHAPRGGPGGGGITAGAAAAGGIPGGGGGPAINGGGGLPGGYASGVGGRGQVHLEWRL